MIIPYLGGESGKIPEKRGNGEREEVKFLAGYIQVFSSTLPLSDLRLATPLGVTHGVVGEGKTFYR